MLTAARTVMLATWGEVRIQGAGWHRRAMRAHANRVVFCRSMLYHVQWFCMAGMAAVTAWHAAIAA